jgi:hypothetical protein
MNPWRIPDWLEREVRERDKACVYCGIAMVEQIPSRGPRGAAATWEHIINDAMVVHSLHYGANALAPDGFTFADADAVIYARALYKPRTPQAKSLQTLIDDDKAEFRARDSAIRIEESKPISTADGQKLRTFEFVPGQSGNWERVAYGEEGDFYLLFTVSARTQEAYNKAAGAYEELISRYRAKQRVGRLSDRPHADGQP